MSPPNLEENPGWLDTLFSLVARAKFLLKHTANIRHYITPPYSAMHAKAVSFDKSGARLVKNVYKLASHKEGHQTLTKFPSLTILKKKSAVNSNHCPVEFVTERSTLAIWASPQVFQFTPKGGCRVREQELVFSHTRIIHFSLKYRNLYFWTQQLFRIDKQFFVFFFKNVSAPYKLSNLT